MEDAIITAAHELSLKFQDDSDIPERFKGDRSEPVKKFQKDSNIEKRFQQHVMEWEETIRTILKYISDKDQAWRFIRIDPYLYEVFDDDEEDPEEEEEEIVPVIENKDWQDFFDYLVWRRDVVKCGPSELGKLCMMHTTFQRVIEKAINTE